MFQRYLAPVAALSLVFAVGCSSSTKQPKAAVPEIQPMTPVAVAPQPIQPIQPIVSDSPTPVAPAFELTPAPRAAANTGGRSYTVQKGDTLFKIARTQYGDASAVRKIKDANPGINADQIKAGQKITLP